MSETLSKIFESRKFVAPLFIGSCVGMLIILDPYIVNEINSEYLKIFPYQLIFLVSVIIAVLYLIYASLDWINENIIYILLAGIIIGDQTKGLAPGIDLADISLLFALLVWFVRNFMDDQIRFEINGLNVMILALVSVIILSVMNGGLPSLIGFITRDLRNFLAIFIIAVTVNDKEKITFFIKTLLIVTSISAVVGILQEVLFLYTGLVIPPARGSGQALKIEPTSFGPMLRIFALTGFEQDFANTLSIAMAIGFCLLIFPDTGIFKRKIYIALSFLLMGAALTLTFTKGAWLAFILTAYAIIYFRKPSRSLHFVALSICMLIIGYTAGFIDKFVSYLNSELQHKSDLSVRLGMIRIAIEKAISQYPYIGRGIGNSPLYVANVYGWPPHNTFIQVLSDVGIIGLCIYALIYIYILVKSFFLLITNVKDRTMIGTLLMGFMSMIIYTQFSPFFIQLFPWVYIGIMGSAIRVFSKVHPDMLRT